VQYILKQLSPPLNWVGKYYWYIGGFSMACKRFLERISVFKGQSKRGATYLFHLLRSYNAYYTFWQQIF